MTSINYALDPICWLLIIQLTSKKKSKKGASASYNSLLRWHWCYTWWDKGALAKEQSWLHNISFNTLNILEDILCLHPLLDCMFEVGCMFLAMLLWECSGVCETRFYLRNIYIVAHGGEEINCASDESNCLEGSSYLLDCYIKWGGRWAWGRIHYLQAYQN